MAQALSPAFLYVNSFNFLNVQYFLIGALAMAGRACVVYLSRGGSVEGLVDCVRDLLAEPSPIDVDVYVVGADLVSVVDALRDLILVNRVHGVRLFVGGYELLDRVRERLGAYDISRLCGSGEVPEGLRGLFREVVLR